ncbi:MAG: glycosyltransferase N-terminal domain-containing protein [Candidatus Poribacteria bacterium]
MIYNTIGIAAIFTGFQVASLFNSKIRQGISVRRNAFRQLEEQLKLAPDFTQRVWFHFTSVGEFEQAKPLIESIKDNAQIILTYFSPSVHPNVLKYPHCDAHTYLPLDTAINAKRLFSLIRPTVLVFSKFDVWPNLVWRASDQGVPTVLIAGTLHQESKRLYPIARSFFKQVHNKLTLHCVISESDAERFTQLCGDDSQVEVTGDTRFDTVYNRAIMVKVDQFLPAQSTLKYPIVIAGSTYIEEEEVLLEAYELLRCGETNGLLHLIVVPHEPTVEHIQRLCSKLDMLGFSYTLFSDLNSEMDLSGMEVIVIDTVGLLAELYRICDVAFVGGSFHGRVHNVMEPAAMAKPIVFGPRIENSYEAGLLKERHAARQVNNAFEMADIFRELIFSAQLRQQMGERAKAVIVENLGASQRSLNHLERFL